MIKSKFIGGKYYETNQKDYSNNTSIIIYVIKHRCLCICNSDAKKSSAKILTSEEYYSTLKAEYAKYGITYEVLERNNDAVLTEELLQKQLREAKQEGEALQAENNLAKNTYIQLENESVVILNMPVTYTATESTIVKSPSQMGNAEITTQATITENAQYGTMMGVSNITSYQMGGSLNFESWEQTSASSAVYIRHLYTYVNGILKISYTDPWTGSKIGYTSQHTITELFVSRFQ